MGRIVRVPDAEPSTTARVAATNERDRLLATKLYIPRPRPGFLVRPGLLERVTDATTYELTLISAPAGFGKTSLLGDWARRSQHPVAWLSLDGGDSQPARFWRYVAAGGSFILYCEWDNQGDGG